MTLATSASYYTSDALPVTSTPDPGGDLDPLGDAALGILSLLHGEPAPHQVRSIERSHRLHPDGSGRWATPEVGEVISRQNGKTDTELARLLAGAYVAGDRCLYVAHSGEVARSLWLAAAEAVERIPLLDRLTREIRRTNGQEALVTTRGGVILFRSATGKPPRGFRRVGLLTLDELMHHSYSERLLAALMPTQAAHPRPMTRYTSSAGDARSTVLNRLRDRGEAAASAGQALGLSWAHYAAAPDCQLTDPAALAAANPALGRWLTLDYLQRQADILPEPLYRTEHLGQWVALMERWLPTGALADLADPAATVPDDARVAFGLDADADLTAGAISAAWLRPDGRVHVETILNADRTNGSVSGQLLTRAVELARRWRGATFTLGARGPLASLAVELAAQRVRVNLASTGDLHTGMQGFARLVSAGDLVHPADPPLTAAVDSAVPRRTGATISYRLDLGAVAPLTAAVYACHTARAGEPRAAVRALGHSL